MAKKQRLDVLLVERGLAESREKAKRLILAGLVYAPDRRLDKPGMTIDPETEIRVKGSESPYVSRGGLKLEGALKAFEFDPAGLVALDLGASTGGFTDCLLQHGAAKVYAIDVGRGQLHNRLLNDPRVVSREKTHLDSLEPQQFDPRPQLCVADLSFISLRRAYPVVRRILIPGGRAILLVKPQFEVGRERLPKGGVVKDEKLRREVLDDLKAAAVEEGLEVTDECESPIQGSEGNVEFFLFLKTPAG